MKGLCCLVLLIIYNLSAYSQHTISGMIVDDDHNALLGVNILLYAGKDSVKYVKGTTTNADGRFILSGIPNGEYILYSSMIGFESIRKNLHVFNGSLNIDTLKVRISVNPLEEIIIKSNSLSVLGERAVKMFTMEERRRSSSALDLMRNIPQITLDVSNNALLDISGKRILIICNGVKVSEIDLIGLRPKEIQKAEYYANPPLKYINSGFDSVLFVVTKSTNEKGGYITTHLENSFTTGYGTNIIQGKYSSGSNDYILRYFIDYRDLDKNRYSQSYSYLLNEDKQYKVAQIGGNGDYVGQYHNIEASFSKNKHDNLLFIAKTKLSINPGMENYPQTESGLRDNVAIIDSYSLQHTETNYLSPNLDLYFSKKMASNQEISLNVVNTYYNSSSEKGLKTNEYEINTYLRNSSYSIITEGEYTNQFERSKLSVGARYFYKTLNECYEQEGSSSSKSNYSTHNFYFFIDLTGQVKKLYYTIGCGGEKDWQKTDVQKSYFIFKPMISLSYKFDTHSSIKLRSMINSYAPNISLLTNNPIYIEPTFISIGNPDLKPYYKSLNNLLYSYNSNSFYAETGFSYTYMHKPFFPVFMNERDWIQKKYSNIEYMHKTSYNLYFNWKVAPFLNTSIYYEIAQQQSRIEKVTYNNWYNLMNATVTAFYKNFTLNGQIIVRNKDLNGMMLEKTNNYYSADLTWKKNDLAFTLGCLFLNDPTISQTCKGTPVFYKESKAWNNFRGLTYLQFVYTIPFGKKIKRSMRQNLKNEDGDTGIYIDSKTKL